MKRVAHLIVGMAIGALMATFAFAISSRVATAQDPVKQSPQYYKVLLENDQLRVLEYRLKPGEKEPMHSHTAGVVYSFSDGKLRTTLADGTATESAIKGGEVFWRTPVTHALENIGDTEAHALAVELKNACKQK
jgi:quercetin dioxygenase-like cupin family protein